MDSWGRGRDAKHAGPALGAGPRERRQKGGTLGGGAGTQSTPARLWGRGPEGGDEGVGHSGVGLSFLPHRWPGPLRLALEGPASPRGLGGSHWRSPRRSPGSVLPPGPVLSRREALSAGGGSELDFYYHGLCPRLLPGDPHCTLHGAAAALGEGQGSALPAPRPFLFALSVAAFPEDRDSLPREPKTFTLWPLAEKVCGPLTYR